jgi:hypothetical protein
MEERELPTAADGEKKRKETAGFQSNSDRSTEMQGFRLTACGGETFVPLSAQGS